MKELLVNIGIDNLHSFLYEYESITLDWWDLEHKTSIEIEAYQNDEGFYEINIFFSPEAEEIEERQIVYIAFYKENYLQNQTLIEKRICEKLIDSRSFDFSEEHNAYLIDSYEDTRNVFSKICNLLENKNPIYKVALKKTEEQEEIVPYKLGDTLDHFIAMMFMNSADFTEENIIENIELSIELEGTKYLSELKNDVNNLVSHNLNEDYGLDDEMLEFIKKIIKNYMQSSITPDS